MISKTHNLFDVIGTTINVIKDDPFEHSHFQEKVVLLYENNILVSDITLISIGDLVFINAQKFRVNSKLLADNFVIFKLHPFANV